MAGCTGGISGSAQINFVENYLRPLGCGTIALYNDYIVPFNNYYMQLNSGACADETFNTGGCSSAVVWDGYSGDVMTQLDGLDVFYIKEAFSSIETTITTYHNYFLRAAAYKKFSDGDIKVKTGTGGCDSCQ